MKKILKMCLYVPKNDFGFDSNFVFFFCLPVTETDSL